MTFDGIVMVDEEEKWRRCNSNCERRGNPVGVRIANYAADFFLGYSWFAFDNALVRDIDDIPFLEDTFSLIKLNIVRSNAERSHAQLHR